MVGPRLGHGDGYTRLQVSARPPYVVHDLTSLFPLSLFPASHIQSIGVCYLSVSPDFYHVLFGTLPVEIRRRSPLRFSSSLPRALPSALGPPFTRPDPSPTEVTELNLCTTTILSYGPKSKRHSRHREPERKAGA